MLCIEMVLLGGRYRACSFEDRRRHEWPPEPARLFFTAVNAVYRENPVSEQEVAALRWWETLGPPEISCSDVERLVDGTAREGWTVRNVADHYVPGNYARSSSRDLNVHWEKIEQAQVVLAAAVESGVQKEIDRASRGVTSRPIAGPTSATPAGKVWLAFWCHAPLRPARRRLPVCARG